MRAQKRNSWLTSVGVVMAVMAFASVRAAADVVSDQAGSIVIWPKVLADGTRDTIIQLTNTKNMMAHAHCNYVQGTGFCSLTGDFCTFPQGCPTVPFFSNICETRWQKQNFEVTLTKQQPTIWRVSTGRMIPFPPEPPGDACKMDGKFCPGMFMGNVPPPPQGNAPYEPAFRGELRCIQTNMDGSPSTGNALKGEAIIATLGRCFPLGDNGDDGLPPATCATDDDCPLDEFCRQSTQISKYSAIIIRGIDGPVDGADPFVLPLNDIGYNACPVALEMNHYAPGAEDIIAAQLLEACNPTGNGSCPVRVELTVIPCRIDYLGPPGVGTPFNPFINVCNEDENCGSFETRGLKCWVNGTIEDTNADCLNCFTGNLPGSLWGKTIVQPLGDGRCIAGGEVDQNFCVTQNCSCSLDSECDGPIDDSGVCGPPSGLLAIIEEFHEVTDPMALLSAPNFPGTAAANAHSVGGSRAGRCRGNITLPCTNDADCNNTGFCRKVPTTVCTSNADCVAANDFCDICMNDEIIYDPN